MGLFSLSLFKSPIAQPSVRWVNTYTLDVPGAVLPSEVPGVIINTFRDFECGMLLDLYQVVQATMSTWVPDGTPYDPETFVTDITIQVGERGATGEKPLPLRDVLYVRRETEYGRSGKIMYRGCLTTDDVQNTTGEWSLLSASTIYDDFDTGYANLDTALVANAVEMVLVIPSTGVSREVVDLEIAGVRSVSRNHRWFNQTA